MKKTSNWFHGLSSVGKFSVIGALILGAMTAVSASNQPTQSINSPEKHQPSTTTYVETETQPIPFERSTIEDGTLAKGSSAIRTEGVDGLLTITHEITTADGVEVSRKSSEVITSQPTTEVTAIGTYVPPVSNCDSNYSGCVPLTSYDLDCGDIGHSVTVYNSDPHGFDRDNDGYGCESY